jgi:hypothetical protein
MTAKPTKPRANTDQTNDKYHQSTTEGNGKKIGNSLDIPFAQEVQEFEFEHDMYDIYFLGIIDIFQTFNNRKRMENMAKSLKIRVAQAPMRVFNPQKKIDTNISAVEPSQYYDRFMKFIRGRVIPRPNSVIIPDDEKQRLFLMWCLQYRSHIETNLHESNIGSYYPRFKFNRSRSRGLAGSTANNASALALSMMMGRSSSGGLSSAIQSQRLSQRIVRQSTDGSHSSSNHSQHTTGSTHVNDATPISRHNSSETDGGNMMSHAPQTGKPNSHNHTNQYIEGE